jgi:DNA-binding NtrC family response regulator
VVQAYAALGTLPAPSAADEGGLDRALYREMDVTLPYADQKDAIVDRFTRLYLEALLTHTSGNQTAAAELAGLGRTYLCRLLQKHGLTRRGRSAPEEPE